VYTRYLYVLAEHFYLNVSRSSKKARQKPIQRRSRLGFMQPQFRSSALAWKPDRYRLGYARGCGLSPADIRQARLQTAITATANARIAAAAVRNETTMFCRPIIARQETPRTACRLRHAHRCVPPIVLQPYDNARCIRGSRGRDVPPVRRRDAARFGDADFGVGQHRLGGLDVVVGEFWGTTAGAAHGRCSE
jgi:hypothetical protein